MSALIVIVALLVGAVAGLILWSLLQAEKAKTATADARIAAAEKERDHALETLQDRSSRLEAVILGLKTEIMAIEATQRTCRDPLVIRDRLHELLRSQEDTVPL